MTMSLFIQGYWHKINDVLEWSRSVVVWLSLGNIENNDQALNERTEGMESSGELRLLNSTCQPAVYLRLLLNTVVLNLRSTLTPKRNSER